MKNPWKSIKKNTIYQNKYGFTLREDDIINPKGNPGKFMVLEHPGYVCIVALTSEGNLILVRQWRYPPEIESLEIVTGALNEGESDHPLEAAKRELLEEVGGTSNSWHNLNDHWMGTGFMKKRGYIYLALDVELNQPTKHEETEFIEIEQVVFQTAVDMVYEKKFQDEKTPFGILLAKEFLARVKS